MEKQLLVLLNYNLRFDEDEACRLFAPFLALVPSGPVEFSVVSLPANTCSAISAPVKDITADTAAAAATRADAMTKVVKASKVRTEAQQQMQSNFSRGASGSHLVPTSDDKAKAKEPRYLAQTHVNMPAASIPTSSSASSVLTSAVRGIARRLSAAHLRQSTSVSGSSVGMYTSLSTESSASSNASTASSSSDLVSLVDDTGSASSSSSGWMSSGSDTDDSGLRNRNKNHFKDNVGIVDPSTSLSNLADRLSIIDDADATIHLAGPGTMKKPFLLRPSLPSFKDPPADLSLSESVSGHDVTPTRHRVRMPSDTSSVHTITNSSSPTASVVSSRRIPGHVVPARGVPGLPPSSLPKKPSNVSLVSVRKDTRIPSSSTMPSISHPATSNVCLPSSVHPSRGGGGGRLRSGTIVRRPASATKSSHPSMSRFRLNVTQQPPSLLAANYPSSSNSSSSLTDSGNTSAPSFASNSTSTNSTRVGVGSLLSRMWGAAAANLKGVSGGGGHYPSDTEAERLLNGEGVPLLEV